MSKVAIVPMFIVAAAVVVFCVKFKAIPWALMLAYSFIVIVTILLWGFLLRHPLVNYALWCPISFALTWWSVMLDTRRARKNVLD